MTDNPETTIADQSALDPTGRLWDEAITRVMLNPDDGIICYEVR